jgi:hypothetical protein
MTPLDYAFLCLLFLFFGAVLFAYWRAGEASGGMA